MKFRSNKGIYNLYYYIDYEVKLFDNNIKTPYQYTYFDINIDSLIKLKLIKEELWTEKVKYDQSLHAAQHAARLKWNILIY